MPAWVDTAYNEYSKRLRELKLILIEIDLPKRSKTSTITQAIAQESEKMLDLIDDDDLVIALDERGESWSSVTLSNKLSSWMESGKNICLLVGGPDGLSEACKKRAQAMWSLSALTLPHPLIRPILAEQLYRAWSILAKHPYHRV